MTADLWFQRRRRASQARVCRRRSRHVTKPVAVRLRALSCLRSCLACLRSCPTSHRRIYQIRSSHSESHLRVNRQHVWIAVLHVPRFVVNRSVCMVSKASWRVQAQFVALHSVSTRNRACPQFLDRTGRPAAPCRSRPPAASAEIRVRYGFLRIRGAAGERYPMRDQRFAR